MSILDLQRSKESLYITKVKLFFSSKFESRVAFRESREHFCFALFAYRIKLPRQPVLYFLVW